MTLLRATHTQQCLVNTGRNRNKGENAQKRNFILRPSKAGMWFRINNITFGFILKATKLLKIMKLHKTRGIYDVSVVFLIPCAQKGGRKFGFQCGKAK
jgi:hypothetical protein